MDVYQYSLKPQVCLPFAAGVQMHITLWSADTCMTKVDSWWPCTIPITNLSITASQGTEVGEDIHRLQNTYCTAACCGSDRFPRCDHIPSCRKMLNWNSSGLNVEHQFIINVISFLIQHDANLSQPRSAACCLRTYRHGFIKWKVFHSCPFNIDVCKNKGETQLLKATCCHWSHAFPCSAHVFLRI